MSTTIDATFDGTVFRPINEVALPPDTLVRLTIEELPKKTGKPHCFLEFAKSLNIEGPADWSENLDEYLYHGKPLDGP